MAVSCEREVCTYWYRLPMRERLVHVCTSVQRERDFTVHTCTSLLWERDVYIFVPISCERERFVHILVPDTPPLVRVSEGV